MRRRSFVLLFPAALLTLTGCIDVSGDVTVNSDASATGTISMSMERESASLFGIDGAETLIEAFTSGEIMEEGLIPQENCTAEETNDRIAITCTFTNTVFDEPGELWQITRIDDSLEMRILNLAVNDMGMLPADIPVGELVITAAFPGPITSIEGDFVTQLDDRTARVDAALSDFVNVTITADVATSPPWIPILGGVLVAGLALGGFLLWSRRRNARNASNVLPPELPSGEV